ncbi:MAG: DUF3566 domain-containing protein, partial [Acidimicrobiales bacterium]|nr:DUF3566 domain-containing protein [Acidimicrobiales bacterium]
ADRRKSSKPASLFGRADDAPRPLAQSALRSPNRSVASSEDVPMSLLDELAEDTGDYEIVAAPGSARRRPRGRLKARKVKRIIRYVSPWSVFKVSLLFYFCLWVILTVAGVILWQFAVAAKLVSNLEDFLAELFASTEFHLDGRQLFRASAIAGVVLVFAGTGFTVLMSLLFNVICDVTGGIRLTVLELESTRQEVRTRALGQFVAEGALPPQPRDGSSRRSNTQRRRRN